MTTPRQTEFNSDGYTSMDRKHNLLSQGERLDKLIDSIDAKIREYAQEQIDHIRQLTRIGIALSAEKNIGKLLELIVDEARYLAQADAGTLYTLDRQQQSLKFEILQNDTLATRMGGTSGQSITLPDVPLYKDNKPNYTNVSSYVALTGETVNIRDVYSTKGFDFDGPRNYDAATGYRSRSMLVIPMKNHENEIIGVLQLLNARIPKSEQITAFSAESVDLIAALASQAAVALTNTQLIQDLKELFYAFIESIATAIDAKSPYTAGHIKRVVELTMMIADAINDCHRGRFKSFNFSDAALEELRLAAWMHDVGKITLPENVMDKATKLETVIDRIHLIEIRFELIAQCIETEYLQKKYEWLAQQGQNDGQATVLDEALQREKQRLADDMEFLRACNLPMECLTDDQVRRIHAIAGKTYRYNGEIRPYLSEDEVANLTVRSGSLTEEERKLIKGHASITLKILKQLPFKGKLANVPEYAAGHHERLDGSGYPRGLSERELPLQARIMAVADIFEALTARDRPYKRPMKLSQVMKIMEMMKESRHIDADVFDLFVKRRIYYTWAKRRMNPEQIDLPEPETAISGGEIPIRDIRMATV